MSLTMTAKLIIDDGTRAGDNNFCGVVALAVAADIDYEGAAQILRQCGRRFGRGTSDYKMSKALKLLGLRAVNVDLAFFSTKIRTALTLEKAIKRDAPESTFIVRCTTRHGTHVYCARRGLIHDWTAGRRNRIYEIQKVVPI